MKNKKKSIFLICIFLFTTIPFLFAKELDIIVGEPDVSKFPKICFTISVKDSSGNDLGNLDTSFVKIYEDSVINHDIKIQTLNESNNEMAILITVDASLSMAGNPIDSVKSAIKTFINNLNENTTVSITTFHDKVDIISPFTTNQDSLLILSDSIKAIGRNTELYEGVVKGLEYLHTNKTLPKNKAIIVLSDGKDEGTAYTDNDAVDLALEYGIPIFSIGYHTSAEKKYLKVLDRMSFKTGGVFNDAPVSKEIKQIYNQVYEQIKSQQIICFTANLFKADSLEHKININIITEKGNGNSSIKFLSPFQKRNNNSQTLIILGSIFAILVLFTFINRRNRLNADKEKEKLQAEKEILENQLKENKSKNISSVSEKNSDEKEVEFLSVDDPRLTTISSGSPHENIKFRMIFNNGPLSGDNILIENGMTVGRSDQNTVPVSDSTVSSNHFKFIKKGFDFFLMDLNSTNGTFVNGVKIKQVKIKISDQIKIGKVNITIK